MSKKLAAADQNRKKTFTPGTAPSDVAALQRKLAKAEADLAALRNTPTPADKVFEPFDAPVGIGLNRNGYVDTRLDMSHIPPGVFGPGAAADIMRQRRVQKAIAAHEQKQMAAIAAAQAQEAARAEAGEPSTTPESDTRVSADESTPEKKPRRRRATGNRDVPRPVTAPAVRPTDPAADTKPGGAKPSGRRRRH